MSNEYTPRKYAILHEKLCDNYRDCPAKFVCESVNKEKKLQPAILYMEDEMKIVIDKAKCSGCASCAGECGLLRIVNPYQEITRRKEFDRDPRNKMNFRLERFGCELINETYALKNLSEVKEYIENSDYNKINILEFVVKSQVTCPFQAIDVNFITGKFLQLGSYKKYVINPVNNDELESIHISYSLDHFPAILLISGGKVLGAPITTDYRIKREDERRRLEHSLELEFSKRLI